MNPELLRQVLATVKVVTLASVLPLVIGLIEAGDRVGNDVAPQLRPLVIALAMAEGVSVPGMTSAELTNPSREAQIDALYAQLADLAEATSIDPGFEGEYRECLGRLRLLQEEEAAELEVAFRARDHVDLATLDAALARADRLLGGA